MENNKVTRLFDIPYYQFEKYGNQVAFHTKKQGVWESLRSEKYLEKANSISRALLKQGVKPGDKIALLSTLNCATWNILDIGIQQTGAVTVPIYPTIGVKDYAYIFQHAEINFCFLSDIELLEKAREAAKDCKQPIEIFSFESLEGCRCLQELYELGDSLDTQNEIEAIKNSISADAMVTIIYTSGTTGLPKGVMLTHKNIVQNIIGAVGFLPAFRNGLNVLSFLPLCHIMERCAVYLYQYLGLNVFYGEGIDKIGDNIKEVKPELMTVVPRLVEKIYDKIYAKGSDLSGLKRKLFYWAVQLGETYNVIGPNTFWYKLQLALARKLIFSKWLEAMGGELNYMICGSAALQSRLIRIFGAAGIKIIEGYGLSESPILSGNNYKLGKVRPGTVGQPLKDISITIADDGEILVEGYNVMLGYYKDEALTNEALLSGVLHTGDKGEFDSDGYLKITGRKKEIFKTSGGKYISPVLIENKLKQSRFIEQVMVVGENKKMPAALIQPDFEFLQSWIERKGHNISTDFSQMILHKKVIKRLKKEVKKANHNFGQWEKIKAFQLTPEVWDIENGLITPTMKMKRNAVTARFQELIDHIYEN